MKIRALLRDPVNAAIFGAIVGAYAGKALDNVLSNCSIPPLSWIPYGSCFTLAYAVIFPTTVAVVAMIFLVLLDLGLGLLAIVHKRADDHGTAARCTTGGSPHHAKPGTSSSQYLDGYVRKQW
jgi:hypothetical protein